MSLRQIDRALCGLAALVSFGLALVYIDVDQLAVSELPSLALAAALSAAPFVLAYKLLMRVPYRAGLSALMCITLCTAVAIAANTYLAPPSPNGRDGLKLIGVPYLQGLTIGLPVLALEMLHAVKARLS